MTFRNFEKARESMVLSQLQPSGIVDERVMDVYNTVPREMFVPDSLRGVCYLDDDIALGHGRVLPEPLIHAVMVQDARIAEGMKILDIGGATGYSAAILASLGADVTATDSDEKSLQQAKLHWKDLGLGERIRPVVRQHTDGFAEGAPYRVILINGAVADVPVKLLSQLENGGTLYAVLKPDADSVGHIIAVRKSDSGHISHHTLGEASTSYLSGFAPVPRFAF